VTNLHEWLDDHTRRWPQGCHLVWQYGGTDIYLGWMCPEGGTMVGGIWPGRAGCLIGRSLHDIMEQGAAAFPIVYGPHQFEEVEEPWRQGPTPDGLPGYRLTPSPPSTP
jgi:hypothetical protein